MKGFTVISPVSVIGLDVELLKISSYTNLGIAVFNLRTYCIKEAEESVVLDHAEELTEFGCRTITIKDNRS